MTTRHAYDSTNIYGIPYPIALVHPRTVVMYYINGDFVVKSVAEVEERFPNASLAAIDVIGDRADYARVADVETADITPEMTEQWISDFNSTNPAYKDGGRPVIYCDRENIQPVRVGTGKYILGKDYYLGVATGDGTLYTGFGVVFCQTNFYRLFDLSTVFSDQWIP